jgi:hypothetical protein
VSNSRTKRTAAGPLRACRAAAISPKMLSMVNVMNECSVFQIDRVQYLPRMIRYHQTDAPQYQAAAKGCRSFALDWCGRRAHHGFWAQTVCHQRHSPASPCIMASNIPVLLFLGRAVRSPGVPPSVLTKVAAAAVHAQQALSLCLDLLRVFRHTAPAVAVATTHVRSASPVALVAWALPARGLAASRLRP